MNIFKINIPKSIIFLTIFSITLNILRIVIWHKYSFVYILWNIVLAFIPLIISFFLLVFSQKSTNKKIIFIIGGFLWLVFIPNAIYITTDFVHLGVVRAVPIIYDVVLLFTSALLGLIFGLISVSHIEHIIRIKYSKDITITLMSLIIFIISFGVYLGRFLRFNSWDIFAKPVVFLNGLKETFTNINNFVEALCYTILFFFFILILYHCWKSIKIRP